MSAKILSRARFEEILSAEAASSQERGAVPISRLISRITGLPSPEEGKYVDWENFNTNFPDLLKATLPHYEGDIRLSLTDMQCQLTRKGYCCWYYNNQLIVWFEAQSAFRGCGADQNTLFRTAITLETARRIFRVFIKPLVYQRAVERPQQAKAAVV